MELVAELGVKRRVRSAAGQRQFHKPVGAQIAEHAERVVRHLPEGTRHSIDEHGVVHTVTPAGARFDYVPFTGEVPENVKAILGGRKLRDVAREELVAISHHILATAGAARLLPVKAAPSSDALVDYLVQRLEQMGDATLDDATWSQLVDEARLHQLQADLATSTGEKALADVSSDATMIAVYPPRDVAEQLAVADGLDPRDLHVTLAFLGEDLTPEQLDTVADVIRAVAARHQALAGQLGGLGRFPEGPDGEPVYVPVDVPGLTQLAVEVQNQLADAGLPVATSHGYTPHLTLTYLKGDGARAPRPVPPTPVEFDALSVVTGDTQRADFAFAGEKAWSNVARLAALEARHAHRYGEVVPHLDAVRHALRGGDVSNQTSSALLKKLDDLHSRWGGDVYKNRELVEGDRDVHHLHALFEQAKTHATANGHDELSDVLDQTHRHMRRVIGDPRTGKAWSPEARAAALEARRRHSHALEAMTAAERRLDETRGEHLRYEGIRSRIGGGMMGAGTARNAQRAMQEYSVAQRDHDRARREVEASHRALVETDETAQDMSDHAVLGRVNNALRDSENHHYIADDLDPDDLEDAARDAHERGERRATIGVPSGYEMSIHRDDAAALARINRRWKRGPRGERKLFDPKKHPRDRNGKFASIGAVVRVGQQLGKVVGHAADGRIDVQRTDGSTVRVNPKATEVVDHAANLPDVPHTAPDKLGVDAFHRVDGTSARHAVIAHSDGSRTHAALRRTGDGNWHAHLVHRGADGGMSRNVVPIPNATSSREAQAEAIQPVADHVAGVEKGIAKAREARGDGSTPMPSNGTYPAGDPRNDPEYEKYANELDQKIDDALKKGLDTESQHTRIVGKDDKGKPVRVWTAERTAEHDRILDAYLEKHKDVPAEKRAVMLGGLPGAGKSTFLRQHGEKLGLEIDAKGDPTNAVVINPDVMKDLLLNGTDAKGDPLVPDVAGLGRAEMASLIHEESSHLANRLADRVLASGQNVVFDITLGDGDKAMKKYLTNDRGTGAQDLGYTVDSAFVDGDLATSLHRAGLRHKKPDKATGERTFGGRYVPYGHISALAPQDGDVTNDGSAPKSHNRAEYDKLVKRGAFRNAMRFDNVTGKFHHDAGEGATPAPAAKVGSFATGANAAVIDYAVSQLGTPYEWVQGDEAEVKHAAWLGGLAHEVDALKAHLAETHPDVKAKCPPRTSMRWSRLVEEQALLEAHAHAHGRTVSE